MDYFDLNTIQGIIQQKKKNVLVTLDSIDFNETSIEKCSDLLFQDFNFSPKIKTVIKNYNKINIKNNTLFPEINEQKAPTPIINPNKTYQQNEQVEIQIDENKPKEEKTPNQEEENKEKENEEDEYERLMKKRMEEMERKQDPNAKFARNTPGNPNAFIGKVSISKISNLFSESNKVRVYLLGTLTFVDLEISSTDSVTNLKELVIDHILKNKLFELKYTDPNAYEIRLADEDKYTPIMDFRALDNDMILIQSKNNLLTFIESTKYDPRKASMIKILGEVEGKKQYRIKIFFKIDKAVTSSKIIMMDAESTLNAVMEYIFSKDLVSIKNADLYYFTNHSEKYKDNDVDNAINLESQLNSLQTLEVDLCQKKFPDAPEKNVPVFRGEIKDTKEDTEGREYIFNEISAGKLQEFEVVKINKYKKKQERILGIDMYNIYNNLPKNKQYSIFNMFRDKTKIPERKIKDIKGCEIMGDKKFYIEMKGKPNEQDKRTVFEVASNNIRNEIVAKLKFLIKLNNG